MTIDGAGFQHVSTETIDKAIERIASGQASGRDAMAAAQVEAIIDLRKAGVEP